MTSPKSPFADIDAIGEIRVSTQPSNEREPIIGQSSSSKIAKEELTTVEGQSSSLWWIKIRASCREAFSEFLGTMILVLFGNGVVAQVTLSHDEKGDYQSISWGWGIGVMLGIYVSGISGSHLNPAVTFTFCLLGGMSAAAIVYGNYKSAVDTYEGGPGIRTVPGYSETASGGIFCTYPAQFMTTTGQFFSEFVSSSILMFVIFALTDKGNNMGAGPLMPLGMFFTIFGIGACFGWETGYAINLARDFGPRLVSYMIGYGPEVWRAGNYYFWVPVVASFLGCIFGGWLYNMFLYVGSDSPINMPYLGILRFVGRKHPDAHSPV
ncbi:aquaporin-like protein [Aspergillus varians]